MQYTRLRGIADNADRIQSLIRILVFLFLAVLLCPIRYFTLSGENVLDSSWLYAVNLAALRGLRFGVDIIWTTGPLAYLFQPLDIGNHLARGVLAQSLVWLVLLCVAADLCFLAATPLGNLVAFTLGVAVAAPLFHFNFMGVENLLLLAILVCAGLLLMRPFRWGRYCLALFLAPPVFLIKGTGAAIAVGVVGGLILALALRRQWKQALLAGGLALLLLPALTLAAYRLSTGNWSIATYLRGLTDISAEYSVLLAADGPGDEKVRALVVFCAFLGVLLLAFLRKQGNWILCLPFAAPLLVSLKHGFVRQDIHVINFFAMVVLLLAVFLLFLESWRFDRNLPLLLGLVLLISIQSLQWRLGGDYLEALSGWKNLKSLVGAMDLRATKVDLARRPMPAYARDFPLEESMVDAIGQNALSFVSPILVQAPWHGLNLQTMPIPQGYQCSSKLDGINAAWLSRRGPAKLLLEWFAVDGHHPLGENPATLLAIYKWYELQLQTPRHLLLRRRSAPLQEQLLPLVSDTFDTGQEISVPDSPLPVFLRVNCELTTAGRAAKLLYRVPPVNLTVSPAPPGQSSFRVILESLAEPLLISHLPTGLESSAHLFSGRTAEIPRVAKLRFSGPGIAYYRTIGKVDFLTLKPADR